MPHQRIKKSAAAEGDAANLLDELLSMLRRQLSHLQQGNVTAAVLLAEQTDTLVGRIACTDIMQQSEFQNRRHQLRKLYDDLALAVTAQKADTADELARIRKARSIFAAYRNSM